MNRNTLLVVGVAIVGLFLVINPLKYLRGSTAARRPVVPAAETTALVSWAAQNALSPREYVARTLARHDIVFLGELPKIRQDVQFVSSLVPRLAAAGVFNLGVEYALSDDQDRIDALLTAAAWDEGRARSIMFDWVVTWGYQEYIDIFHAAWTVNHGRPAGTRPFRIVGLSPRENWQYLTSEKDAHDPAAVAKIFQNGIPDEHMAKVIDRELIRRGEKALIFCNVQHAFTAYRNREYEKSAADLKLSETRRAGAIVYSEIGSRAFTIAIHSPWPDPGSRSGLTWAADGAVDALIDALPPEKKSAGFDTSGPLGALPVTRGYRSASGGPLVFRDLFDGYVILGPLADYRPVTPISDFVRPEDAAQALERFPGPKPASLTAEQANKAIADDAAALDGLLAQFR
ncbi:MAG TPA: hypothetical protein VMV03_17965 [Spirochaetia bacterium]|nr:hypothetical protein [Spirochaetia bacterium]